MTFSIATNDSLVRDRIILWRRCPDFDERMIIFTCVVFVLAFEFLAKISKPSKMGKAGDVVDAYEQGLLGRFPRARYPIGKDCLTFLLLQMIPEWLGDWLIGILVNFPKPVACEK